MVVAGVVGAMAEEEEAREAERVGVGGRFFTSLVELGFVWGLKVQV